MTDVTPSTGELVPRGVPRFIDGWARSLVIHLLRHIRYGRICLRDGAFRDSFGEVDEFNVEAVITVQHPRFYRRVALGGNAALGESFADGDWSCDCLPSLFRILARHAEIIDKSERGFGRIGGFAARIAHALRRNSRRGSRRNISAHYDAGDEFFEHVLDDTMSYSCGIFDSDSSTLYDASVSKLERVCRMLSLQPDDHLLEIGTGWGGLALHAATHYGCRVTTTTISRNQYEYARARVEAAGLQDRITILLRDYRDLSGSFDKLVSIEMIEAVGDRYYDQFFRRCCELVSVDGQMLLQAITIGDNRYAKARRRADFIKQFVFPGSCIPSLSRLSRSIASQTDYRIVHLEDIGPHYARTLREWRENLTASSDAIRSLGYSERFLKLWEYYFAYCEGGFAERFIGDIQMLLVRPRCRTSLPVSVQSVAMSHG